MIEDLLIEYLSNELNLPVCMEVPEKQKRYVLIQRTGGSEPEHICTATVAIQSVAESLYEAARLNNRVKKAMRKLEQLPEVSSSELNSDYDFTDTKTKSYRYQAVYDLVYFENEEE